MAKRVIIGNDPPKKVEPKKVPGVGTPKLVSAVSTRAKAAPKKVVLDAPVTKPDKQKVVVPAAVDPVKTTEKPPSVKKESKKISSITIRENSKRDNRPKWDGHEEWTSAEFSRRFHDACQFYRLTYNSKQLKPNVLEWMGTVGYTKKDIDKFKSIHDWQCNSTMGMIASCLLRGMPVQRDDFNGGKSSEEWLKNSVDSVLLRGNAEIIEETNEDAPTIQERTRDIAMAMAVEIDTAIESFYSNPEAFSAKQLNILSTLKARQVKAAHARYIKQFFLPELTEFEQLLESEVDPQLKEGYNRFSKKQIRTFVAFLKEIQAACDMLMNEAKATRKSKKPKAVSKEKIVTKLKYKKSDDNLKLVSINPSGIIGSSELWVYNTKTRKLGKYIAAGDSTLTVKGTTIINFDKTLSVQKTIKPPQTVLDTFGKTNKVGLRSFLDTISTISTPLTGRINEDIVLLKINV